MPARAPFIRRCARWLIGIVAVLIVVLAIALRAGTDSMWWIEILRYLPLPLLLGPAGLMVAASFLLGAVWRVAAVGTALLVPTVVMGLASGHADAGRQHVRFMTWNVKAYLAVREAGGFARVAWEISQNDPDILVMQDAGAIAGHPQDAQPVRAALAGRTVWTEDQYLVASRYPMKDCALRSLQTAEESGAYVRCTVTIDGKDLSIFTAHLVSPREGLNAARGKARGGLEEWQYNVALRLAQADLLVKGLVQAPHPIVIAGDFNADEHSPIVRRLLDVGLRDAYSSATMGYGYTYGHDLRPGFSFLRLDHVLVSPEIGVAQCVTGGSGASQHRPVIAELLLKPERE